MILAELATYLTAQGITTTIYRSPLRETPNEAIALIATGGTAPILTHTTPGITIERAGVQVLSRGEQWDNVLASTNAYAVFEVLTAIRNQTLSGVQYLAVTANQSPFFLREDESGRPIWAFNVLAEKELS
jgi:hypothetical protein